MTGNLTMDARIHGKPDSALAPTFSWSNDSNTGFYHPSTHHIGVTCAGSLTCTLNAGRQIFENNRVLAWKTSDGTTTDILYVDPVNRVRLFSPYGDMYINEDGTNTCHINYNNTGKFMMYNGTTPILASSGNNIGIGTITPSSALHVIGAINASTTLQQNGCNVNYLFAPSNHTHDINGSTTGTLSVSRGGTGATSLTNNKLLYCSGGVVTTDTNLTYLNSCLGIGTTNPSYRLTLGGESAVFPLALMINETAHATSKRAALCIGDWTLLQDISGNGTRNFSLYQASTLANVFNILTNGNVGIGLTNPGTKLHVAGTGTFSTGVHIQGAQVLMFGSDLSKEFNAGKIGYQTFTTNGLDIVGASPNSSTTRLVKLWDTVRVETAIGVNLPDNPIYNMDVYGVGGIRNDNGAYMRYHGLNNSSYWYAGCDGALAFAVYRSGDSRGQYMAWGGTTWAANSDARLKKDVIPIPTVMESLMQITPVYYNWKDEPDGVDPSHVGFIAQNVQEHFPKIITESKGYLGIATTDMIPYLVKAIQEQQKRIDRLEQLVSQTCVGC